MEYIDIAKLIPAKDRRAILLDNHIKKALIDFQDRNMAVLWLFYATYIEPDNPAYKYEIRNGVLYVESQCKRCLHNLLAMWQALEPHLIELERQQSLLELL